MSEPHQSIQELCCQPTAEPEDRDIGWRCRPCGWETYDLADMHNLVNWPEPNGTISLICPRCGAEGDFVDAER